MPPIRIALVGLSASAVTTWAAAAHLPYLISPRGQSRYAIVALLNSSTDAAEAAKKHFNLPSHVKAYGEPVLLAQDPNIDLVVVNTRVDIHFLSAAPALRNGKAVYVEWPLAENLERAIELTRDMEVPDSLIGLQTRVSPVILKIQEIIESGRLGTVLSSDVKGHGAFMTRDSLRVGLEYFADRKIGGHRIRIELIHFIDAVHHVLGEYAEAPQAQFQIQRPVLHIVDKEGKIVEQRRTDVPDLAVFHGRLGKSESKRVVEGATLSVRFSNGLAFKGEPTFVWYIHGEKGELRITSPVSSVFGNFLGELENPARIELHDFETDEVVEEKWDWQDWQKELPIMARNVGEMYERYAEWVENGKPGKVQEGRDWPRLHDAVLRTKEIDGMLDEWVRKEAQRATPAEFGNVLQG